MVENDLGYLLRVGKAQKKGHPKNFETEATGHLKAMRFALFRFRENYYFYNFHNLLSME